MTTTIDLHKIKYKVKYKIELYYSNAKFISKLLANNHIIIYM